MKAHLIDTHLLVPRSRSSAKVKVKYHGHVSQKMGVLGGISVSQIHLVISLFQYTFSCDSPTGNLIYSYNTDIALSLEKPDATSTGYKFYYKVALDTGK